VVSDEFYPLVAHGAIGVQRGGVQSVKGNVVTFADGARRAFDVAVLCTGYDVATHSSSHPYLNTHLEPKTKLDFYMGCFLPSVPKCAFVGGCFGFAAVPRIAELQSKVAAQPATYNPQPATRNQQPATSNPQPATRNQQPASFTSKP
jgi:hypothetical protein